MQTIDMAAASVLGKSISGRDGMYWDFYRDYFISGTVFNKEKFRNFRLLDPDGVLTVFSTK